MRFSAVEALMCPKLIMVEKVETIMDTKKNDCRKDWQFLSDSHLYLGVYYPLYKLI